MIGVVADDLTGATDIGIMFTKQNYRVVVVSGDVIESPQNRHYVEDVVVVDIDSRLTSREVVYKRTRAAVRWLTRIGCDRYYGKVCSVFRGHVGALFDALLDEASESFSPVVLGFPKNGRETIGGIHYVHGRKLEDSEFAMDPVHPMKESRLQVILQGQTHRRVGTIDSRIVSQGVKAVEDRLSVLRHTVNYVIFDVRNQDDLQTIASAVSNLTVVCGSSAVVEEYPRNDVYLEQRAKSGDSNLSRSRGVLLLAGSLTPQTKRQIEHLRSAGVPCLELDTVLMMEATEDYLRLQQQIVSRSGEILKEDRAVMVFASNGREAVAKTLDRGRSQGLSETQVFQRVSAQLAEAASCIVEKSGVQRMVVGGGDTSAKVCRKLGLSELEILGEIEPGVPLSRSISFPRMGVVLKSGSFGDDEFFATAIGALRTLS